jgi:hypothetical protein
MATDVREQSRQARDEAREQARQARDEAREQVRQAKEQARQAREDAGESQGFGGDERGAAFGDEGPGPEAARRVHEQARRLREEAKQARDEALGGGLGDPVGARFHSGEHDWDPGGTGWGEGPGWTDWPGRRGWEDWARMRGRPGWPGSLDFGTLRDLERVAVQFTTDLRRLAMQSSAAGENVISDLRTILEEALERVKSEIFGSGGDTPPAGDAGKPD